jgi:hypothetical protein
MPLNDGETFAGFTIVRLLGSGEFRSGEHAVQTSMIKNPNPLAQNAVDPRLRVRARHRIQHDRPDPSQCQFRRPASAHSDRRPR